jgi:hypothetical protein
MTGFAIATMRRTSSKLGTGAERLASEPTANSVSRVLASALGLGRACGRAGPQIAPEDEVVLHERPVPVILDHEFRVVE